MKPREWLWGHGLLELHLAETREMTMASLMAHLLQKGVSMVQLLVSLLVNRRVAKMKMVIQ